MIKENMTFKILKKRQTVAVKIFLLFFSHVLCLLNTVAGVLVNYLRSIFTREGAAAKHDKKK